MHAHRIVGGDRAVDKGEALVGMGEFVAEFVEGLGVFPECQDAALEAGEVGLVRDRLIHTGLRGAWNRNSQGRSGAARLCRCRDAGRAQSPRGLMMALKRRAATFWATTVLPAADDAPSGLR